MFLIIFFVKNIVKYITYRVFPAFIYQAINVKIAYMIRVDFFVCIIIHMRIAKC